MLDSMHGRRIALLIGSGLGMLSVLLPWAHQGAATEVGTEDTMGIAVLVAFFISAPLSFAGNLRDPMSLGMRILGGLAGLAASLIGFYVLFLISRDAHDISAGGGLFLLIAAGAVVLGATGSPGADPAPSSPPPVR